MTCAMPDRCLATDAEHDAWQCYDDDMAQEAAAAARERELRRLVVHCKVGRYDVYIGRPSKWGNPFKLVAGVPREDLITRYEVWLREQPELIAALPELRGKVLGCWCAPRPCHGDVLARLANG